MTSPSWAEWHAAKWGRPVAVVTNGHDSEGTPFTGPAAPDQFILTYMGTYYPETQDLTAVWAAIRHLAETPGAAVDRLRFVGELHPALQTQLADSGLGEVVEVTGFLPHLEATARLRSSSALLVAGPRKARGILRGHVVAKLFDYLATGLPIVYVGDPECDAAELLGRYPGCYVSAADDVDGVVRALRSCHGRQHPRNVSDLSRRALTGRLAGLLDHTCGVQVDRSAP